MRDVSPKQPIKRWKLAVIPVLLVVLYKVLAGGSDDEVPDSSAPTARRPDAGSAPIKFQQAKRRERNWPTFSLEDAIRHNPFTFTGRRDDPETPPEEQSEPENLEPIEAAVTVYLNSAKGEVALVDGQLVRVGDVVDGQWRVTLVTPEYAVLAPISPTADQP